jgi:hypothetical protein
MTLDLFGISYTRIKEGKLKKTLSAKTQIVILDGLQTPIAMGKSDLNKALRLQLKNFVEQGGCLIATATACQTIEKMFPDYIKTGSYNTSPFGNTYQNANGEEYPNLDIEPTNIASNLLTGCPPISQVNSSEITIMPMAADDKIYFTSQWLAGLKSGTNIVCMSFNYGKGQVLCSTGFIRPTRMSQFIQAVPMTGMYAPRRRESSGQALAHIVDYYKAPKQIGAGQFLVVNFILHALQNNSTTYTNLAEQQ